LGGILSGKSSKQITQTDKMEEEQSHSKIEAKNNSSVGRDFIGQKTIINNHGVENKEEYKELSLEYNTEDLDSDIAKLSLFDEIEKYSNSLSTKNILIVNCQDPDILATVAKRLILNAKVKKARAFYLKECKDKITDIKNIRDDIERAKSKTKTNQVLIVFEHRHATSYKEEPVFFRSLIEDKNVVESFRSQLSRKNIYLIYLISSTKAEKILIKQGHSLVPDYWNIAFLPALLEKYFKGDNEKREKSLLEIQNQRARKLWPTEEFEYDFYNEIKTLILENTVEEKIEKLAGQIFDDRDSELLELMENEITKAVLFTACFFQSIRPNDYDAIMQIILTRKGDANDSKIAKEEKTRLIQKWRNKRDELVRSCGLILKREAIVPVLDFSNNNRRSECVSILEEQQPIYLLEQIEKLITSELVLNPFYKTIRESLVSLFVRTIKEEQENEQLIYFQQVYEKISRNIRTTMDSSAAGSYIGMILV
jgi:hypothetical protein